MPDIRSGKSKVDQGEQNSELIEIITSVTEIKTLIQLEEEKLVKKQKEGFDMTVWKLQERITTLERTQHIGSELRTQRIGSEYNSYRNKKKCCNIIVCFMSCRHRTMFYRNRKHLKDIRIKLDLTKREYGILTDAIDLAKEHPDLDYVFAGLNCRLKVVFKDGTSNFFDDIDNLKSITNNRL